MSNEQVEGSEMVAVKDDEPDVLAKLEQGVYRVVDPIVAFGIPAILHQSTISTYDSRSEVTKALKDYERRRISHNKMVDTFDAAVEVMLDVLEAELAGEPDDTSRFKQKYKKRDRIALQTIIGAVFHGYKPNLLEAEQRALEIRTRSFQIAIRAVTSLDERRLWNVLKGHLDRTKNDMVAFVDDLRARGLAMVCEDDTIAPTTMGVEVGRLTDWSQQGQSR